MWVYFRHESGRVVRVPLTNGKVNVDKVKKWFGASDISFLVSGIECFLEAEEGSVFSSDSFEENSIVDIRCQTSVPAPTPTPTPAPTPALAPAGVSALDKLLERYKEAAGRSRSIDVVKKTEYDALEPGNNFEIVGRGPTYDVLLKGAGAMYQRFRLPSPDESTYRAGPFFFCMVAFPGAGKTTLGKRGWQYLVESWNKMEEQRKVEILKDEYSSFDELVEESVKYNLVMYHEVENSSGGLVHGETGLSATQILGLRTLYMITYDWRLDSTTYKTYSGFIHDLDTHLPGLKQQISFALALEFLTQLLGLKKRVLATFFFDEVNGIDRTLSGDKVTEGDASWFQMLMSDYVRQHFHLARGNSLIFPVFCIGTTKFSAGDLRFTESRKSTAVLVPFPPLGTSDAEKVVLRFLQDLALKENQQVPTTLTSTVKLLIQLSGGMPRYMSQGLLALGNGSGSSKTLLEKCTREQHGLETRSFLQHWRELLRIRAEYAKYERVERYPNATKILLKALAASILGKQVTRRDQVVPGACQWWELEWSGVTALTAAEYLVTDDPGEGVGDVKLCPLLIEPLVRMYGKNWPVNWPPLDGAGWETKEIADALSVLLRIFLLKEAYNELRFGINDLVPEGAFVPAELEPIRFELKPVTRMFRLEPHYQQDNQLELLMQHGMSGVLGPGNFAADWYIFLEESITIFGQSKKSKLSDNVTVRAIMDAFEKDVGKFYELPPVSREGKKTLREAISREEGGATCLPGPRVLGRRVSKRPIRYGYESASGSQVGSSYHDQDVHEAIPDWLQDFPVVYLFCSTKPVPAKTLAALEDLQDGHSWVRHIVVLHEREAVTRNDPMAILSQVRRLRSCDECVKL